MKLNKKSIIKCSLSIPAIDTDKEGILMGGFSGVSIVAKTAPAANGSCYNDACTNYNCINAGCTNVNGCYNPGCKNVSVIDPTPTPTPSSGGFLTASFGLI